MAVNKRYSCWLLENIVLGEVVRLHVGKNLIGRNNNSHIRVNSNFASRDHAEIEVGEDEETIIITDLSSSNGIYVNHQLKTRAILKTGDLIGVGVKIDYNIATEEHPLFVLKTAPIKCYVQMPKIDEQNNISSKETKNLDASSTAINSNISNNTTKVLTPILNTSKILSKPDNTINFIEKPQSSKSNVLNGDLILISEDENSDTNISLFENDVSSPKSNVGTLLAGDCIVLLTEESSTEETTNNVIKNAKLDDNKNCQKSSIVPLNNISDNNENADNKYQISSIISKKNMSDNNKYADEEEEFILTQKTIDDIKAEFLTDDENDFEINKNSIAEPFNTLSRCENFDSVISISDDDYDADLEEKVSVWSNKLLLSQSAIEQSQIFEANNQEEAISTEIECEFESTNQQILVDEILFPLRQKLESHKTKKVFKKKKKSRHIYDSSEEESTKSKKTKKRNKRERVVENQQKNVNEPKEVPEKRAKINSTTEVKISVSNETKETYQNRINENKIAEDHSSVSNDNENVKPNKAEEILQIRTRRNTITDDQIYDSSKANKLEEVVEKVVKKKNAPPQVITPPNLPICRGKLRGVSASTASTKDFDYLSKSSERINLTKKDIAEKRKEILKTIAEKNSSKNRELELEREKRKETIAKVKITKVNRGAFLTNDIPKTNRTILRKKSDDKLKLETTTNTALEQLKRRNSICGLQPERKEKIEAREKRTTNKITFASMQKNITESSENQRKLQRASSMRSCLSTTVQKVVKRVRFAEDRNQIYYIESRTGATKKVDKKDAGVLPFYSVRKTLALRQFPRIRKTEAAITNILTWGNLWLKNRDADAYAASQSILPMPDSFKSFDHYINIILPLMKIEFMSSIQRSYRMNKFKPFKVKKEHISLQCNRVIIITKYKFDTEKEFENCKCDLVLLNFGKSIPIAFAYASSIRKATDFCSLIYEILGNFSLREELMNIVDIEVSPIYDNVRIELGTINAIYQLENTPLCTKLLNPLQLIERKQPSNRSFNYKGCDAIDEYQLKALNNIYAKVIKNERSISLIQGPPGTGKSCVITNLVLQCLYGEEVVLLDKKILICAQNNIAIDVLTTKLLEIKEGIKTGSAFKLIRYGVLERIDPRVQHLSVQRIVEREKIKRRQIFSQNKAVHTEADIREQILKLETEIEQLSTCTERNIVTEHRLDQKRKRLSYLKNSEMTGEEEYAVAKSYLEDANIVCATLSSCVKLSQIVDYFDICIIDEATQCAEPLSLLPFTFGITNLILVGDSNQLPATVLSVKANDLGYGTSIFTRVENCITSSNEKGDVIYLLRKQYRMHPDICQFPNQYFYNKKLVNADSTKNHSTVFSPYYVLSLDYKQNEKCGYGQVLNELEASFIANLIACLNVDLPTKKYTYGVITAYAEHRNALDIAVKKKGFDNIMVKTIDSYQGHECDVIIISNARTVGVGFLSSYQRLNVALTRAKRCLFLCGNFCDLESVSLWRCLLTNARERNLYLELNAFTAENIESNVIDKIRVPEQKQSTN